MADGTTEGMVSGTAAAAPAAEGAAGGAVPIAPAAAGGKADGAPPAVADGTQVTPPPYTPNFKYKVRKEEREIPAWARSIVTSSDAEKQVRDLFERAEGLDEVKQHREVLIQENQQMREHWAPAIQQVQVLTGMLKQKDYDSFFGALQVPEVDILKYALHRLQLREKPELMAVHDQMRQIQLQNQELQNRLNGVTTQAQTAQVNQVTQELDQALTKPEVSSAVQAFDARVGKPGAFRTEVILRGKAYHSAGQDISVEQAVLETLQRFGWQGGGTPGQQVVAPQVASAAAAGGGAPQASAPPPTLPNIKGKGTSPTKKVAKSTNDLRELARQMRA